MGASKWSDHRADEIKRFALTVLDKISAHRHDDGGFSFFRDRTQTHYYGAKVSDGLPGISDLHGTKLFVWATVMIADLLEWRQQLTWSLPVV